MQKKILHYLSFQKSNQNSLTDANNGVSDTQFTVRRQFVGVTNASGVVTFTAGSNETFAAFAEKDYTVTILDPKGTGVAGDIVSISGKVSGTGTASLTITDNTYLRHARYNKTHRNHIENICSIKNKNNATI